MAIQNAINQALRAGIQFILGSDATGDLYYRSATGILARLGIGTQGQILAVGANGLPAWSGQILSTSEITTTTQAAAINTIYIPNATTLVTITLPAVATTGNPANSPQGSIIEIVGKGAGGWRLAQNATQQVIFGNMSNTAGAGGQVNSTHARDCIRLVCTTADTVWQVASSIGNLDVI